jgi:hypothetical protein
MNISPGFPRKELVSAMRPFLKIYLLERYSFSSMTRKYSAKKLDFELKRFIEKNPLFGRRIATVATDTNNPFCLKPNKICKTEMKYITETTQYPRYSISNYMNTHIYDEDIFYRYVETGDSDETYHESDPDPIDIDDYEDPTQSHDEEDEEEDNEDEERVGIIGTQTRTVISAFAFSSPQQPIVNQVATEIQSQLEPARTPQQIRETTLSILNRLGRIRSSLEREEQTLLTNNSEENDDYDTENEEDEVINNQDQDEDNDSAEYMEEDEDCDSVS